MNYVKDICIIVPYENLKKMSEEVVKKGDFGVNVVLGDLREGVRRAKEAVKSGVEVVISRGGTATLIKENVDVPVVEINVSGFDLLRIIYPYKELIDRKIGIIGYSNVIYGMKSIANTIDIDIEYYEIETIAEVESKVKMAISNNISIIIGDTIAVRTANKYGMETELITSGKEAILSAILEANKVYEAICKERKEKERFKIILDFAYEGIIAVDKEGIVTVFNPQAEKIFKINQKDVLNKKSSEVIPNSKLNLVVKDGKKDLNKIQNIGDVKIATNRVPIIVGNEVKGAVATFQDVTKIQESEKNIRQKLNKKGLTAKYTFEDIIGNNKSIMFQKKLAKRYAEVDSTVLILGDSGTGKELFAHSIHNHSKKSNGPFVAINCTALPRNLLESELFGYEEGSFTGAQKGGKSGLFELAHKGTIFLDEIGKMDKKLQARLLRVIQEKRIMRLGGREVISIDIRIIAASNSNLKKDVKEGLFRKDLYYRLNVLELKIPPLKERKEDIEILTKYIFKKISSRNKNNIKIGENILDIFKKYDWPGNVRELENMIEKIIVISDSKNIIEDDIKYLLPEIKGDLLKMSNKKSKININTSFDNIEKQVIEKLLEEKYSKTEIANTLDINRSTLWRKIKEYDLN